MIYLDYNATTPVVPEVLERMLPYFGQHFGNPSSGSHSYGWTAQAAVETAAESLAELIRADPADLIFTSGATESVNTAIKGMLVANPGGHVITSGTEHKAVLDVCNFVEREGGRVTVLPTDRLGQVDLDQLSDAIDGKTILVAVMWANNETGTIAPIEQIAELVHAKGIPLLTDATQAVGKVPVSVASVDFLACSAHKFYGPKGVGALYVKSGRDGIRLPRFIEGGGQQKGRRGGTLNVPSIVGIGAAADLARDLEIEAARQVVLRDRLERALIEGCPGAIVNGDIASRLPQTSSISFPDVKAAKLMAELRSLAVSNASACQSASGKPSHVLTAMGLSSEQAHATIRFSLGRPTTDDEISDATGMVLDAWSRTTTRQPETTP